MATSKANDLNATLRRRLSIETAAGWKPEEGAILTGTLAAVRRFEGDFGAYPVLVIETPDGQFHAIHAFHQVLREQLVELAPTVGDLLTTYYAGRRPSKNVGPDGEPRQYEHYVVLPGDGSDDGSGTEFDWTKASG
jgi:hypothetical protein